MSPEEKKVVCSVKDLGMAAFLKMQGFALKARLNKEFQFYVPESEQDKFNDLQIEYVNSSFAEFDGEIMNLKKLSPRQN